MRKGRTLLTALGLGVGVGLVVTVSALGTGLDRAQKQVLEPLTGVDEAKPQLGAIGTEQITKGRYLRSGAAREAVINESYAKRNGISVGERLTLDGKSFTVVGLARSPLGGQASDAYVKLAQLQTLSDREGRVNTVQVRADSGDDVAAVEKAIRGTLAGASVTTASDLADRVGGSLADAENLSGKLGRR